MVVRHGTVLIADDHVPTRAAVRVSLERGGFDVCAEAPDAATSVALARRLRPDVALLDIHMPGSEPPPRLRPTCPKPRS